MKFLVDMPLSPELAKWLCSQGHDAIHASFLNMQTAKDEIILDRAIQENRIVVTADLDFTRLFTLLQIKNPGLILFRSGNFSEEDVRKLFERVLQRLGENEIVDSLIVVEPHRIRRRPLPVKNQ